MLSLLSAVCCLSVSSQSVSQLQSVEFFMTDGRTDRRITFIVPSTSVVLVQLKSSYAPTSFVTSRCPVRRRKAISFHREERNGRKVPNKPASQGCNLALQSNFDAFKRRAVSGARSIKFLLRKKGALMRSLYSHPL